MVRDTARQDARARVGEGMPMNAKTTLGLVALVAFAADTASAGLPRLIRGQTPEPATSPVTSAPTVYADQSTGPIIGTAPGYGERPRHPTKHRDFRIYNGVNNHNFGYGNGYYGGHEDYYRPDYPKPNPQYTVGGAGGYGSDGCPCGGSGCSSCKGLPHHYNTYRYKGYDNNYVYPSPQVPAGLTVYPYYTHKGPSDFFME